MEHQPNNSLRRAIQGVAIFEAAKGVAALLAMFGLLSLLHHDMHRLVAELIGHFGLSPYARYPAALLDAVDRINATPVRTVVLLGCAYVAIRWIEAWGLWHDKAWGEWFGALSSGIYIPLEVKHLMVQRHWQGAVVLVINVGLILVLLWRIRQRGQQKRDAAAAGQSNFTRGSTQT